MDKRSDSLKGVGIVDDKSGGGGRLSIYIILIAL